MMQAEVAKPPRVYPFDVEPNDVTRNRKNAGPYFYFQNDMFAAIPCHCKSGVHRWWLIDVKLTCARWNEDGEVCIRSGTSFEEVTRDFKWCFEDETNSQSGV